MSQPRINGESSPNFGEDSVLNVLHCWEQSTPAERRRGARFYPEARGFCSGLADLHGLGLEQVVGALAVLSPSVAWSSNCRAIVRLLESDGLDGLTLPGYKSNWIKAWQILRRADLTQVKGSKVKAFYQCILTAGETEAVCIDRWMARVVLGNPTAVIPWLYPALYRRYAGVVLEAANRLGRGAPMVQAVTWYTIQRLGGQWSYKPNLAVNLGKIH